MMRATLRHIAERMKPKLEDSFEWFTLLVALSVPLSQLLLAAVPFILHVIGIL